MTDPDDSTYLDRYGQTWARPGVRPAPSVGDPLTAWPDSPLLAAWREVRESPELLSVRCGADGGRCRTSLGAVWATHRGFLLHAFAHVAPTRVHVNVDETDRALVEAIQRDAQDGRSPVQSWAPGQSTGITQGLPDGRGVLMLVDDASQWFDARVGCLTHAPVVELDRLNLLAAAERAAALDRHRASYNVNPR